MINQILVTNSKDKTVIHPLSRKLDTPLNKTQIVAALETQCDIDSFIVKGSVATIWVTFFEDSAAEVGFDNVS